MRSAWELVVLAVGTLVAFVVSAAALPVFLWLISGPNAAWPQWLVALPLLLAVAGAAAWVFLFARRPYRMADRHRPFRAERLGLVMGAPAAVSRFPHRLIEHALRRRPVSARGLLPLLRRIPPGQVVFANLPNAPKPTRNAVSFEPTGITHDVEQLNWLLRMNLEQQGLPAPPPETPIDENPRPTVRESLTALGAFLQHWQVLLWWAVAAVYFWKAGWSIKVVLLLAATYSVFTRWILPLLRERRWWLVPGGLVLREFYFWRKDVKVKLYRPADTPLFMDAGTGTWMLGQAPVFCSTMGVSADSRVTRRLPG